ncbi:dihydrolipoamide acetyltransferase family protein [Streptomyces sp. NPDC006552]|uniref:dihydrolipoamide acetyltransferase family protein n=1 Tax=Streptomyces sp. NPDC006552 TaxID=3157179 RepID=UPI00339FA2E7
MAQVLEFRLPDLGEGLTEAEIVRWLVAVGDVVAVDQPVVEVETAKAMVEVPCPYGGVVTARFGEEGTELPVGAPLVTVAVGAAGAGEGLAEGPTGGVTDGLAGGAEAGPGEGGTGSSSRSAVGDPGGSAAPGGAEGSGNVLVGYGTAAPPARRRRVRTGPGPVGIGAAPVGTAPVGSWAGGAAAGVAAPGEAAAGEQAASVLPRPVSVPTGPASGGASAGVGAGAGASSVAGVRGGGPVPVISPLVRKLAREGGLDLREVAGSGPDGLILRSDVERAMAALADVDAAEVTRAPERPASSQLPQAPLTAGDRAPGAEGHRTPLRGVRGAVADKLSRSRREIPDATCWVDADATALMHARVAMNSATGPSAGPKISVLALLARICTVALARYPELNATVDMERREVVRFDEVHLGFAAQTPRGLVVPVVRDAHARGAESLSGEFARLTDAARAGTLTPRELTGGTFTLNNYGVFGVDGSTPIINHPEAAMLGVGRIVPKPWVHEGELAVRQVVQLSLTFDHRVCDGGTAGGFLRYVADCVEQPAVLLRTL